MPIIAHYLRSLFLWVVLWLLFFLAFIWIIDPYGVSPLHINLPGINTKKPQRLDIDHLIKPYEVWRYQPKTVFLGTSRIQQSINPAILDGTEFAPAYNAAVPASTLAENAAYIEQYLQLNPYIKHIFIELFFYNFSTGQVPSPAKTWRQFISNTTSLLISSDAFYAALRTLAANRKHDFTSSYIEKRGYRVMATDFNPAYTFSELANMRYVIASERTAKIQLQPSAIESLDRIVSIANRHGVQLHLLLTPNYPWDDYRLLSLGYWPLIEQWLRKMANYPNVVSFSQYNALLEEIPTVNPRMQWWNDPTHFSLQMGQAMMRRYLGYADEGVPENFMRPVTPATVEAVIAERRAGLLNWMEKHPDFVNDFETFKKIPDALSGSLNFHEKTLLVDGNSYSIVPGMGEVEFTTEQDATLSAYGWAIDEVAKRHPSQLIATIGSAVVARGFTTVDKLDNKLALVRDIKKCGFTMEIPLKNWNGTESIRIFALMNDGRAVQLASQARAIVNAPVA